MIRAFVGWRRLYRPYLRVFLPSVTLATAVAFAFLQLDQRNRIEQVRNETTGHLHLQVETVRLTFRGIVSDLLVLSELNDLHTLLERPSDAEVRQALGREFLNLARRKGIYDQVRFLDETGMERVRINWNGGNPELVADERLQNKGKRYYFRDAFELASGEVFVSPLDLNIERGQVERPFKPMIRFGTPVVDATGAKRGIVLVNYLADDLLRRFKGAAVDVPGQVYLINREAYWLASPNPEQEWGFMFEDRADLRFSRDFPDAWSRVRNTESGQFSEPDGLFTFATLYPLAEGLLSSSGAAAAYVPSEQRLNPEDYFWKIVSRVPAESPYLELVSYRKSFFLFYGTMVLMIAIGARMLVVSRRRELDSVVALNNKIQELETTREELVHSEKMASLGRMVAGFAHEVNTPIGIAVGAASHGAMAARQLERMMRQDEVHEEDIVEQIEIVNESSELALSNLMRAGQLVQSFKRTSVDQASEQPRDFRYSVLVDDVITSLHNEFKRTRIRFDVRCPDDLVISGVPGVHSQLLTNLIVNSLRHGFAGGSQDGTIGISVYVDDDRCLRIGYSDTGAGMASDVLEHIFEPFFTTDRSHGGSGLGMYICYNLVTRQLGGTIVAQSAQGKGVLFRITHPLKRQQVGDLAS